MNSAVRLFSAAWFRNPKRDTAPRLAMRHVVQQRQARRQAGSLAVLGNQRDAGGDRVARRPELHLAAAHQHAPAVQRVDAEDCAARLGAPGAHQAGHPDDLAGPQREGDVVQSGPLKASRRAAVRRPAGPARG